MSKEEIALQLTLSKVDCLKNTKSANSYSENEVYNIELGKQVATLYNTIYNELDLNKTITV